MCGTICCGAVLIPRCFVVARKRSQDLCDELILTDDPPQALCQLCHGYELAFAGLRFNSGANDRHGRCVQWTHPNPFPQVVDGTCGALSDTANLFDQFKRLK